MRKRFFSQLQILFSAAAGLSEYVQEQLQELAMQTCGRRIVLLNSFGATETGPLAFCSGSGGAAGGRVGMPVPGVELKLAPVNSKLEARLRGVSVTPGFWKSQSLTEAAFDDEGFFKTGDALAFVDPQQPWNGLRFDGRIGQDFKLSTGTWVNVEAVRAKLLSHLKEPVRDVVLTAPDRDYLAALIFVSFGADEAIIKKQLTDYAKLNPGHSTCVRRALLIQDEFSLDTGEVTEKGSINQHEVLRRLAVLVDKLYAGSPRVIDIGE